MSWEVGCIYLKRHKWTLKLATDDEWPHAYGELARQLLEGDGRIGGRKSCSKVRDMGMPATVLPLVLPTQLPSATEMSSGRSPYAPSTGRIQHPMATNCWKEQDGEREKWGKVQKHQLSHSREKSGYFQRKCHIEIAKEGTESGDGLSWSRCKKLIGKDDINLDKNL